MNLKHKAVAHAEVQGVSDYIDLRKICVVLIVSYFCLAIAFYFLAGEQLKFRDSRANLTMPAADYGTVELVAGSSVEQVFTTEIQRLEQVSVTWGTYYRPNDGTVLVELYNQRNNTLLMSQSLSATEITEGYVSTLTAQTPIEGLYQVPLLLRITSPDSVPGHAVSPMMSVAGQKDGFQLYLNGSPVEGMLSFSAKGEDYIWTGLHYWKFVAAGAALLALYLATILYKERKGKKSLLLNAIIALKKYWFLIRQLVSRDFKSKYKRSVLGVLWSFLNPLLTMSVQYLVFSSLFRFDIPYYPVYLLCGIIMFNFFNEACGMTLGSIVGNASLITKVYVPKYIYPLTRTLSSLVNLLISLAPLLIVVLISGLLPTKAYFLLLFELVCLTVFSLGLGLLLSAAMVFFRDTQFLWSVVSMIWMYLTPIFYPENILPPGVDIVLKINPLYYFVKFTRICIIDGVSPEPLMYVQCFIAALAALALGAFVFKKSQDKFVLYI